MTKDRTSSDARAASGGASTLDLSGRHVGSSYILQRPIGQGATGTVRRGTRLTDFGVARILNTPSMTTPNAVVGTPHYMSPEAFHSSSPSPATDAYALGVLLYELVTAPSGLA